MEGDVLGDELVVGTAVRPFPYEGKVEGNFDGLVEGNVDGLVEGITVGAPLTWQEKQLMPMITRRNFIIFSSYS